MTEVIESPQALFARCEAVRRHGGHIGFVPTMGALHEGHLSLVRLANERGATFRVVSIFVNPMQFGPREDFARYPRTLDADLARCEAAGVEVVYVPSAAVMYPPGFQTHVEVGGLSARFEGAFRPGHFRGVTTVVTKLLTAVGACTAIFGRKDYQQWKVLAHMASDLDLPVQVVGGPTLREPDGLAMSSRNRYLTPDERARALRLVAGLRAAWGAWASGVRTPAQLAALCREQVERACDQVDYVAAADPETLEDPSDPCDRLVLLLAARIGTTRLIDNLCLGEEPCP